jgi:hypothetical protein
MNAVLLEQTATQLTRQTLRWDRRLRLATSLVWVPRGLMVGLFVGIVVAVISRLRLWLLPEQIAQITVAVVVCCGVGMSALIWLWPRSKTHRAQYFDYRFGLKERVSTALELSGGLIPLPDRLAERQLTDAVSAARRVDLTARLPLRVHGREILAVLGLAALLAFLLIEGNPLDKELRARRELKNAINSQAGQLENAIQEIEQNPALSAEEKETLTQPLEEALDILRQPDVSQEEAVAALAEASQSLQDLSDGMRPEDKAAYRQAADQLDGSNLAGETAQALQKPDLGETADAMDNLADQMSRDELSQQEQQDLADQLEAAADALQQSNPAMAEKLREAAEALRQGDIGAAEKALREAAEMTREQQKQLEDSPMSQTAQQTAQQMDESQRNLAQAGQQATSQPSEGSQAGQQGQQQSSQGQESEPGSQSEQGQPSGGQPQAGESGAGQLETQSEGEMVQQGAGAGQSGSESQGQSESSVSPESGGQEAEGGDTGSQASQGQATGGDQLEQGGALSAGAGEGGAGTDTITGSVVESESSQIATDNAAQGGGLQEYDPAHDPSTIGGQSSQLVDVGGEATSQEGDMVREGEFGPNPEGVSTLSYTGVYSAYQGIVSDALESGRIPLDQRDVIHDYFSSLDR